MRYKTALASLLVGSALMATPPQKKEELSSIVETGEKASLKLLGTLGGSMKKHMKAQGPLGTAKFCASNAYPLTDKVSSDLGEGVSVKRISLKYRNPANQPATKEERAVLESFASLRQKGMPLPEYQLEQVGEATYKYYKPLTINKGVCLKCHGNLENNSKLASFIKTNYPDDKATGYQMGDLRGAIVVTIERQ